MKNGWMRICRLWVIYRDSEKKIPIGLKHVCQFLQSGHRNKTSGTLQCRKIKLLFIRMTLTFRFFFFLSILFSFLCFSFLFFFSWSVLVGIWVVGGNLWKESDRQRSERDKVCWWLFFFSLSPLRKMSAFIAFAINEIHFRILLCHVFSCLPYRTLMDFSNC